jgi:hypothetical protein
MARKKTVKQDNVTITTEEQENSVADITGTLIESPAKQTSPTLGQAQSLALREKEEEKPKPMAQEQPKELAQIAEKQVFDCMSFLNKQRLKPVFTNYGKKASCIIVDNDGNNVLPWNEISKTPMIVYGDDKDRALINAVNALKNTYAKIEYPPLAEDKKEFVASYLQIGTAPEVPLKPFPFQQKAIDNLEDEYGKPFEDPPIPLDQKISRARLTTGSEAQHLIQALTNFIHALIEESAQDPNAELKDKIAELLRKL